MKSTLAEVKKELRRTMRERRAALSPELRAEYSQKIHNRLLVLLQGYFFLAGDQRIGIFLSNTYEPQLDEFVELGYRHENEVFAPRFDDELRPFYAVAPHGENIAEVPFGKLTLRAPQEYSGGRACTADELHIILVPGLAFDPSGNRLGQGGGWYDKVLSSASNALKVGVCFDWQIMDAVPHEPHDVRVDYVVTEQHEIDTRKSRQL